MLAVGGPWLFGEPGVDDVGVGGKVSDDAIFGESEGVGVGGIFVDDSVSGASAGGVDKADVIFFSRNEKKGDVGIEAYDVNARASFGDFVEELLVVHA